MRHVQDKRPWAQRRFLISGAIPFWQACNYSYWWVHGSGGKRARALPIAVRMVGPNRLTPLRKYQDREWLRKRGCASDIEPAAWCRLMDSLGGKPLDLEF